MWVRLDKMRDIKMIDDTLRRGIPGIEIEIFDFILSLHSSWQQYIHSFDSLLAAALCAEVYENGVGTVQSVLTLSLMLRCHARC